MYTVYLLTGSSLKVFISIELIATGATINFVMLAHHMGLGLAKLS